MGEYEQGTRSNSFVFCFFWFYSWKFPARNLNSRTRREAVTSVSSKVPTESLDYSPSFRTREERREEEEEERCGQRRAWRRAAQAARAARACRRRRPSPAAPLASPTAASSRSPSSSPGSFARSPHLSLKRSPVSFHSSNPRFVLSLELGEKGCS